MKIRIVIFLCAALGIMSVSSQARVFVQTGIDVGQVTIIGTDHSITMDNGLVYRPARSSIALDNLHAGDMVSICYTVGAKKSRMYFKINRAAKNARSRPLSQPPEKAGKTLK